MINRERVVKTIESISDAIIENSEMLNDLDRAIGDADHGINMKRGFEKVKTVIEDTEGKAISEVFKTVGMTLLTSVGGASGPLYATVFLKFADQCKDVDELNASVYENMLDAAIEGMKKRGKSDAGCKTMLDVWIPYADKLKAEQTSGTEFSTALSKSVEAAHDGFEYSKTIIATKGRASYLGERSIGHGDPGAASTVLILESLSAMFQEA
jgi:dihydroxyacetone kinase-like protein